MNATATRKSAELRFEQVKAGRRELGVIYRRRWAITVVALVREVSTKVYRNGMSKCDEHGTAVNCSHVIQLRKTCDEYGIWN